MAGRRLTWIFGALGIAAALAFITSDTAENLYYKGKYRWFPTPGQAVQQAENAEREQCWAENDGYARSRQRELARGQRDMIEAVRKSNSPELLADLAARQKRWGLIRAYAMSHASPLGVQCAEGQTNVGVTLPVSGWRVFSDVGLCETFGVKGDCNLERQIDRFAVRYNRAIALRSDYPYRDICRPIIGPDPDRTTARFGSEALNGEARDAFEAARRGDIGKLALFVKNDPKALTRRDGYDRAPLTYAIQYDRREAVDWLISHGATTATACGRIDPMQPFRQAFVLGRQEIAVRLAQRLTADAWDARTIEDAAKAGNPSLIRIMLASPKAELSEALWPSSRAKLVPEVRAIIAQRWAEICPTVKPVPGQIVNVVSTVAEPLTDNRNTSVNIKILSDLPRAVVLRSNDFVEWKFEWNGKPPPMTVLWARQGTLSWPNDMAPDPFIKFEYDSRQCPERREAALVVQGTKPGDLDAAIRLLYPGATIRNHRIASLTATVIPVELR